MPISLTDEQIQSIVNLYNAASKPLNDKTLPSPPHKNLADLDLSQHWSQDWKGIRLVSNLEANGDISFTASGKVSVALFNDNEDKDDDGIINAVIPYNTNSAWLKYSLVAQAKASAALKIKNDLGFSFGADQSITLAAYRIHEGQEKLSSALANDLTSFPTIFDVPSLLKLKPLEAVTMRVQGSALNMELSIDWVQILSAVLPALQTTLAIGNIIKVAEPSAKTKFTVEITDDFSLAIFNNGNGTMPFTVKLSSVNAQSFSFGLDASISVGLEPTTQKLIEDTLNASLAEIITKTQQLNTTPGFVGEIIRKLNNPESLTPLDSMLVDVLVKALRLTGTDTPIERVKQKYNEIKATIENLIKDTIKISISYEYRRWISQSAVLEATMTENALVANHLPLLRFNIDEIFNQNGKGVSIQKSFTENIQETTSQSGFSLVGFGLNIFKTTKVGTQWKESKTFLPEADNYAYTNDFNAQTTNSEGLFGKNCERGFNLHLDIASEPNKPIQSASSLYLKCKWKGRYNNEEISGIFDHAALWGVISPDNVEKAVSDAVSAFGVSLDNDDVTYTCELKFGADAMKKILPILAGTQSSWQNMIISSLAAAIPYKEGYGDARKYIAIRRDIYNTPWENVFKTDWLNTETPINSNDAGTIAQKIAGPLLHKKVDSNLWIAENNYARNAATNALTGQTVWFAGLLFNQENGVVVRPCFNMYSGMKMLHDILSMQKKPDETTMTSMLDAIYSLAKSSFGLRVLGTFLIDVMRSVSHSTYDVRDVERTLTIKTPSEDSNRPALVISEPFG